MRDFYSFDEFSIPYRLRVLFWSLYIVVFVYAVWKIQFSSTKNERGSDVTGLFGLFFVLYAIFYCINPDYFRYRAWINLTDFSLWDKEKFYAYLVLFCRRLPIAYPFEVFRLIVWGGAICFAYLTYWIFRRQLLPGLSLLLLFVFFAGTVCYARASLAMAIYLFGIALYLHNKDKGVLFRLPAIFIAILSYYFHREMIVGVGLLPILFIPFEKKRFAFLSILGLFVAVFVLSFFATNVELLDSIFDNDDLSSKMEDFNEMEQGAFRLSTFIGYAKYFYPFYLITKIFWRNKVPYTVAGMYRITYGILIVSVAFMFVSGLRSIYTYRVLFISMMPLTLLMTYCYCNGYFKKRELIIMLMLALLSNSSRFINA